MLISQLLSVIVLLLIIEGFYSGSEIALISSKKLVLKQKNHPGSKLALKLSSQPEKIFSTTLLMNSICIILISSLFLMLFTQLKYPHAEWIATIATSPLIVLFGELIPKSIYQRNATFLAPWVAYPIYWTYLLFFPITKLLSGYTKKISKIMDPMEETLTGKKPRAREELKSFLFYERTEIKKSEKKIIHRIFNFKNSDVKKALIPLVQVTAMPASSSIEEALEKFKSNKYSRIPIYKERINNIIGILEIHSLIHAKDMQQSIEPFAIPPHYVANTQSLQDLLFHMRFNNQEIVIVVDEHGGATGILTLEDIIEEIVGEIHDEYDIQTAEYKTISKNSWMVQGNMEIKKIEEQFNIMIPQGDYETLNGFLLQEFKKIPKEKDEIRLHTPLGTWKFLIQKVNSKQVTQLLIEKLEQP